MAQTDQIVVFGVASDGSVEQWDGHATPEGILLRWFADPILGYPELGFDLYRARVPDTPTLPFNDLNVPLVEGKASWKYADRVTLSTPTGLHFAPSSQIGWWRLIIAPGETVTVRFNSSPAWLVTVQADVGTSNLSVIGSVDGAVVRQADLTYPGATLTWRTRGVEELELTGDGSVSFIGYHLLDDAASWQQIAHRCLPVIDPGYPCRPQPAVTEADEAKSRLPAGVAAEWARRFDAAFANLLPSLQRLATQALPTDIPPDPRYPDVRLNGDEQAIIALSSLDPHGARILGLAYDDPLAGALDGQEYVYKVVGRWLGQPVTVDLSGGPIDPGHLLLRYDLRLEVGRGVGRGLEILMAFPRPAHAFSLEVDPIALMTWAAEDGSGGSTSGTLSPPSTLTLAQVSELRLTLPPGAQPDVLRSITWTPTIEHFGLLPGIVAAEPGPPPGPASLTVTVVAADSPSAIATADFDWAVAIDADDSIPEGAPISYQIGHRQLSTNPTAPSVSPTSWERADLLYDGAPIFVSAALAQLPSGRALHTDRNDGTGLGSGWWGWWIRGVDIFGRVSAPSPWVQAVVQDTAPPPAPIMVQTEWVQRGLPPATVAVLGRSTEAARWLDSSAADEGLVASWAFGPDQAALCQDVDGFQLLMRRAALPAGAPAAAALEYRDPWPAPIASFGPMAIRADGQVTVNPSADPTLAVTIVAVQALGAAPNAKPTDPVRSACTTDLDLDGASGVFVGGALIVGATTYKVAANGDGPHLNIVVQHAPGAAPAPGLAQLKAASGQLVELTTNLPGLSPPAGLRARSGVLVVGTAARRLHVLRNTGGVFLCRAGGAVAAGDAATWFPVWCASLDDSGFGPMTSETVPVAHAQVAVRAVRKIQSSAVTSPPCVPLTVTVVDLTRPTTPTTSAITFDPIDTCVLLASRADWYGQSRFTLGWAAQADRRFTVYRALGDEINRLDRIEYEKGARRAQNFPQAADWPAGVNADQMRRTRVLTELAALATARAMADSGALDAAYGALTIDTQMLLARQDYAWPAFVAVFGEPITANSCEDTLDGRSHGHWFYRVTSRTAAGLESAPSEPTPPICCPDVVPPAVPLAHIALGDDGAVKLRWLASSDADLDHYDIYAAQEPEAGAELAAMTPVAAYTPAPPVGGVIIEQSVARPPGEWCFWIVAVDDSGNRSEPSAMLKGRALRPPPQPPVWVSAERTPAGAPDRVTLTWTHPSDQRLACQLERRPGDGGFWSAVSPWLPRGVYATNDLPPDLDAAWEYRLRVRDHIGQVASTMPSITLGTP